MTPPGGVPPPGGVKNGSKMVILSQNIVILSQNRLKNDPPGGVKIDPQGGSKCRIKGVPLDATFSASFPTVIFD